MWNSFETTAPGKWVLAGEHAVLRGASAVALPHPEFNLKLRFTPATRDSGGKTLQVVPASAQGVVDDVLQSLDDQWREEERSFLRPAGKLEVISTIPIGAGLGSSAALCVALTRWFGEPLRIAADAHFEFATQLEHRFHGRSSGMDVAAIISAEPISFMRGQRPKTLGVKRIPKFTFHDTGLRARTSDCVLKVENFREESPTLAMKVDEQMGTASRLAMEGLIAFDSGQRETGLRVLAQAMKQAQDCFYAWELVPGAGKKIEEDLLAQGALATKITGAGGGGMVVALWG
jgi:mevalonate kinase